MSNPRRIGIALSAVGMALAVAVTPAMAAAPLPQGSEPVNLDPVDFTTRIDNPYFPLVPGDEYVYRESDGKTKEKVVLGVSHKTKLIANGITARIVHDRVTERGKVVEDTFDWYAQHSDGNVWYLGEDTVECRKGKIKNHSGSFEAGVDGAQPGVIMPANPEPGMKYRQEYYAGEAEDHGEVLSVNEQVESPYGYFTNALLTKDLVPLEPKVSEYKIYAPGVGMVVAVKTSGGSGREELLRIKHERKVKLPSQAKRCVA